MKYRPDDAELLDAIGGLLEDEVMGAVPAELQHKVRVAAHLIRVLQRGQVLEPAARERERAVLAAVLGHDRGVAELRAELDDRLGANAPGLDESAVWDALVAIARDDLAVAKPGYESWTGE